MSEKWKTVQIVRKNTIKVLIDDIIYRKPNVFICY